MSWDLIYYLISLGLLTIICIVFYKKLGLLKKMVEKDGCKQDSKKYLISGTTIGDKKCKLFETEDGKKVAVCRDKDKIKVFEIED